MRLTALDIREQQFRRVMRGFDPDEVVTFLETVAQEYEQLVSENRDLRQRLLDLEHQIAEFQNMEKALRDTLMTAERVTAETRDNAQKEAGLILREAEMAARQATEGISAEILHKRRELSELQRRKKDYLVSVRALAQSHLEMVESAARALDAEPDFATGGNVHGNANPTRRPAQASSPRPQARPAPPGPVRGNRPSPLPSGGGGVIPSAVPRPASPPRVAPAPQQAWAEASFEPGDLIPRQQSPGVVSEREADHYRRGIAPGPLPSLLRAEEDTLHQAADMREPHTGARQADSARAVRPDGSPGE